MKQRMAVVSVLVLFVASGAVACGAVQDEVQQQAEDELQRQKTKAEQRLEQEKTKVLENARTSAGQGE